MTYLRYQNLMTLLCLVAVTSKNKRAKIADIIIVGVIIRSYVPTKQMPQLALLFFSSSRCIL